MTYLILLALSCFTTILVTYAICTLITYKTNRTIVNYEYDYALHLHRQSLLIIRSKGKLLVYSYVWLCGKLSWQDSNGRKCNKQLSTKLTEIVEQIEFRND